MNTYFNEITSTPVNTDGGNVVYKIPAGAFCGNGDLGVVFDNDERGLVLHISKCDFWKFAPGATGDGGIKTVGNLRFSNVDLSNYNIKQYFDKGLLECRFGNAEIEFFIAPENVIYFEIKTPVSDVFPTVDVELPDTCNSKNSVSESNGIRCFVRSFEGNSVERETSVILCCREIENNTADSFSVVR